MQHISGKKTVELKTVSAPGGLVRGLHALLASINCSNSIAKLSYHHLVLSHWYVLLQIFMHPNFNLENPDTFNAVFPWTQIEASRQEESTSGRQSAKLLQEKVRS